MTLAGVERQFFFNEKLGSKVCIREKSTDSFLTILLLFNYPSLSTPCILRTLHDIQIPSMASQ